MGMEECDYCGQEYDSNSEGHDHVDGVCECMYCQHRAYNSIVAIIGKKFCSPECESNFIKEH